MMWGFLPDFPHYTPECKKKVVKEIWPNTSWKLANTQAEFTVVEVRDSPARDICSLHVVLKGSDQMGRVLGTPPPPPSPSPSPPSPSPGSSGRHSGWGTIFGVCPDGIGLRWDISGHPYRGFAQNLDIFHMGIVVWPGEPFLGKNH